MYLPPKVVHLRGKSTVEEIGIVPGDMPNIFVEALTIADGKVHDEVREIAIPPESRVVDVAVEPSQKTYKPGQKAKVKVKLTGPDGKPFVGSTVLAVYDKAVEYISGGSNVPDIKEFFWKWKRSHHPQTESSLDRWFHNLSKPDEVGMQNLGVFGGLPADREDVPAGRAETTAPMRGMMGGMGGAMTKRRHGADGCGTDGGEPRRSGDGRGWTRGGQMPTCRRPVRRRRRRNRRSSPSSAPTSPTPPSGPPPSPPAPDGTAEVEFTLPESLTTWKVKTWAMGLGTKVGQGESEIVTTKDLLVRLQAPRFFVEKDEVVLSANVHNKLKTKKAVQVVLELDGSVLEPLGETAQTVEIAAGSEHRVDWRVKVAHEGQAVIRMKALTDEESDAAQMTLPGLCARHAQDGILRRRDPARPGEGAGRPPRPGRTQAGAVAAGSAVLARPWPARWSMPCPTSPTIPTAAPSRPSTASCRRSSPRRS